MEVSEDLDAVILQYALQNIDLFSQFDESGPMGPRRLFVQPFESQWTSPLITPGGELLLTLLLTAEVSSGLTSPEMGGQARIGDPFSFSGDPLLTLSLADSPGPDPDPDPESPVPEPDTLWLLVVALVALVMRRSVKGR